MTNPAGELMEKISSRDDYVDNLKSVIEEQSFDRLMDPRGIERAKVVELRALTTITANLEAHRRFRGEPGGPDGPPDPSGVQPPNGLRAVLRRSAGGPGQHRCRPGPAQFQQSLSHLPVRVQPGQVARPDLSQGAAGVGAQRTSGRSGDHRVHQPLPGGAWATAC